MWDLFAGEGPFDGSKAQQSALLEAMRDFEVARSRPLPFGAARQFTFSPDMNDDLPPVGPAFIVRARRGYSRNPVLVGAAGRRSRRGGAAARPRPRGGGDV